MFAGYFIYDFIALWINGILYPVPMTHHLICFGIFSLLAYSTHGGTLFLYGFILCEMTGPLQNVRDFLKIFGYKDTKVYAISELIFLSAFILLRCGVCTYQIVIPNLFYLLLSDLPAAIRYGLFITFMCLWVWSMQIAWRMARIINTRATRVKKFAKFKAEMMMVHFTEWINPIGEIDPDFSEDSD